MLLETVYILKYFLLSLKTVSSSLWHLETYKLSLTHSLSLAQSHSPFRSLSLSISIVGVEAATTTVEDISFAFPFLAIGMSHSYLSFPCPSPMAQQTLNSHQTRIRKKGKER